MKVFLVGYMGVGKTSLGSRLAKELQVSFIDLDQAIEKREKRPISQIFSEDGEAYFREKEALLLRELGNREESFVLSTGGGVPIWRENMDWMNRVGCTLWLKMPLKMIYKRLEQGRSHRPLIANKSNDELMSFIQTSLNEREAYYSKAHLSHEARENDSIAVKRLAEQVRNYSR